MEKIAIPDFIIESQILTPQELALFASIEAYPTLGEIDAFQYENEIQEILNAFIGDQTTRQLHQLKKAKEYLQIGELKKAWMVALI